MKKFVSNLGVFAVLTLLAVVGLTLITQYVAKSTFDFTIPKEKNILVLGNSHPECAIDDAVLPRVFNLARSGSAYFYDFVKAKKILAVNPQIDTLILGYTYDDISKKKDAWFNDEETIKYKMRNHFFIFDFDDYFALFKANPISVLTHTPQTIMHNIKVRLKGMPYLGGFIALEQQFNLQQPSEQHITNNSTEISHYQTTYLLKIYELCQTQNIQLVLLATPIHESRVETQKHLISSYCSFAKTNLPKAILIDDTHFEIPLTSFADEHHLNRKGAAQYSTYLKNKKFVVQRPYCSFVRK